MSADALVLLVVGGAFVVFYLAVCNHMSKDDFGDWSFGGIAILCAATWTLIPLAVWGGNILGMGNDPAITRALTVMEIIAVLAFLLLAVPAALFTASLIGVVVPVVAACIAILLPGILIVRFVKGVFGVLCFAGPEEG